ncbi:MAG: DUF4834 family protein [Duncaniella sp.]|nr:DUF4834 family protein [Duncaniella sp.]
MWFIITLIIFYFVVRAAWPWISRKMQEKAARMMADRMRRDFEQRQQADPYFSMFSSWFSQSRTDSTSAATNTPARRKVFTRDMGEYAEFEDLEGNYHYQSTESRTVVEESQISDAEWEEIR